MEKPITALTHFDTFNKVLAYLPIKDRLNIGSANKQMSYLLNEHILMHLSQNNLQRIPDKSGNALLKHYLNRNLRVVRLPSVFGAKEESNHYNFLKGKIITRVFTGKMFTAFLDAKDNLYYTKTAMLTVKFNPKVKLQTLAGVKKVYTRAERLMVLKADGSVLIITPSNHENEVVSDIEPIHWSKVLPVQNMAVSYTHAVLSLGKASLSAVRKQVLGDENAIDEKLEEMSKDYVKLVTIDLEKWRTTTIRYYYDSVKSMCVGHNTAYFVNAQNRLLQCELTHLNQGQTELTAKPFVPLEHKSIIRVESGFNYFVAHSRTERPISKWDNDEVVAWMRKEGFNDYINIVRAEKVTGRKLLNMDKHYMEDVLGITNGQLQQKITASIEQKEKVNFKDDELYGWGNNQHGQLCNTHTNYANRPIKMKIPELTKYEYIEDIVCGWYNTFIKTSANRLFVSIMDTPDKKREEEVNISDEEVRKDIQKEKKAERKRKQSEKEEEAPVPAEKSKGNKDKDKKKKEKSGNDDFIKDDNRKQALKFEEGSRWLEYKGTRPFQIDTVKDMIFMVQLAFKEDENAGKKKIRTAKAAIDKILWDPNLDKKTFKVGYFDKYVGVLETTVEDYEKSQIKEHRVIYLKRKDELAWHREDRIDLL